MLPKRLDRKVIYESEFINLFCDKVLAPSGKIIEKYHILDYPKEAAVVLLTNSDGKICFIKSLRYTTQEEAWELPAGAIEEGEDVLVAAARETLEETGFKAEGLKHFYKYNPANGMSNQVVHVVFGKVGDGAQKEFDTDEVGEVRWFSISEVRNLIDSKGISDGISLMPLLMYLDTLRC